MSIFEMAKHYYQDYTPPLWNEARLNTLVQAGKLLEEQKKEIMNKEASSWPKRQES